MIRHRILTPLALALLAVGCRESTTSVDEHVQANPDWTEATHGRSTPNFAVVFPQDSVNRLEIIMTAAQWQQIRANMVTLFGSDFGSTTGGPGPGGPGGGAFPTSNPVYVPVTLRFNGKEWKNVGFRLKGNSSLNQTWRLGNYKLPFRLNLDRFEDSLPEVKNQRLYGFKELSMSSGWNDNSLIREKVVPDIMRMWGIPAAHTAFYRVYIDFGAGLKYDGVYTMVEVIEDTMVDDQFTATDGNLYKPQSRFTSFNVSEFPKKTNEDLADWGDAQRFVTALNSPLRTTDPTAWRTNLEATFNVDRYLKWLAADNAIVNWDTYGAMAHNYYLYNDAGRLTWIPWDHNQAMTANPPVTFTGSGGVAGGNNQGLSLQMNEAQATSWPLLKYVADDPVYFARYKTYMRSFVDNVWTEARVIPLFEKYHGMVAPYAVGANGEQPGYTHLPNAAAFTSGLDFLRTHVRNRRDRVNTFVPVAP